MFSINGGGQYCAVSGNADLPAVGVTAEYEIGSAQIVYAQQIPRKDARPLIRKDYRRAFGDGSVARTWRHFFSIAAAAAPRPRYSIWQ